MLLCSASNDSFCQWKSPADTNGVKNLVHQNVLVIRFAAAPFHRVKFHTLPFDVREGGTGVRETREALLIRGLSLCLPVVSSMCVCQMDISISLGRREYTFLGYASLHPRKKKVL